MIKTGRPITAFLLTAALLVMTTACTKKPPMIPTINPLADTTAAEAGVTLFGTLHLGMRPLDTETRARYFKEVAGQLDPFSIKTPDGGEAFLVFLFSVENLGEEAVLISPAFASLLAKKGKTKLSPFEPRELSSIMATNPAYTPSVAQRIHPATININPGQRLAKLLVFPALGSKAKLVEVLIPSVMTGNLVADASFPFTVIWEEDPEF